MDINQKFIILMVVRSAFIQVSARVQRPINKRNETSVIVTNYGKIRLDRDLWLRIKHVKKKSSSRAGELNFKFDYFPLSCFSTIRLSTFAYENKL